MSFEPASPISVVTCEHCQGKGCKLCDHHGIYALQEDQPVVFNLPDFIDLKARRFLKRLFWIKRLVLFSIALSIIIASWTLFGSKF